MLSAYVMVIVGVYTGLTRWRGDEWSSGVHSGWCFLKGERSLAAWETVLTHAEGGRLRSGRFALRNNGLSWTGNLACVYTRQAET